MIYPGLLKDLETALQDAGRARRLVARLAEAAPQGRQNAWDTIAVPVEKAAKDKRPSRRRALALVFIRLHRAFFDCAAAEAPERMRRVLAGET